MQSVVAIREQHVYMRLATVSDLDDLIALIARSGEACRQAERAHILVDACHVHADWLAADTGALIETISREIPTQIRIAILLPNLDAPKLSGPIADALLAAGYQAKLFVDRAAAANWLDGA